MFYNPSERVVVHDDEVIDFDCGEDLDYIASVLLKMRFELITEQQAYIRLLKLYHSLSERGYQSVCTGTSSDRLTPPKSE